MTTLNNVVAFVLVLFVLSVGSVACGDSDNPTAPSSVSSTTMAEAPPSFGPSTPVRTMPASFDADNLRPDARGWNAYDFTASWDGRMLGLVLVEDRMRDMREASKPHRNRLITVGTCPVEPHHSLQACGDPIWQATMRLAGRLELDPIPLASCEGWIVVNAAELYDDKYDGWRNAPCPTVDDDAVSSDGTGSGWPEYPPLPRPMAVHSLPITVSDPTGDLDWATWVPSFNDDYDGGSRLSTDVTSLSLSDQDANGWIRVTVTLADAFNLNDVATAATSTPRSASAGFGIRISPVDGSEHGFGLTQVAICTLCVNPSFPRTWQPNYDEGDGRVPTEQARSYVRVPSNLTGSTFSFDIRPPANLRNRRFRFTSFSFGVRIDDNDGDSVTYGTSSTDYISLPPDFTLPDLP